MFEGTPFVEMLYLYINYITVPNEYYMSITVGSNCNILLN